MFYQAGDTKFKVIVYKSVTDNEKIVSFIKETQPKLCLLDARCVISFAQIKLAVMTAIAAQRANRSQSKSLYVEILRCFSPDGRLGAAFQYFAFGNETKCAIAITLEDTFEQIEGLGSPVPIESYNFQENADLKTIRDIFQITDDMLAVYTYEEIIMSTVSVLATDLMRLRIV